MPIIERLVNVYKFWEQIQPHIPRVPRYSIGLKVDRLFIETIESIYRALQSDSGARLNCIKTASQKLESLKFMLRIAWEIKALDDRKYLSLSEAIAEIGRMIGGWQRKLEKETPI